MGMVWILVFRVSCGSIRVTVGRFCKKVDRSPRRIHGDSLLQASTQMEAVWDFRSRNSREAAGCIIARDVWGQVTRISRIIV